MVRLPDGTSRRRPWHKVVCIFVVEPMRRASNNARPPQAAMTPGRLSHRVIASLNREQVDYLDQLGKDAQFSAGIKLSRTQILAAMVNVLLRLHLSGEGITTAEQFEQRILDALAARPRGGRG